MLDKNTEVEIINRFNGETGYVLNEGGRDFCRMFNPRERKLITMGELRQLSYKPGGAALLRGYFIINNKEALEELVGDVEPEYFYNEEDVKKLLLEGSLDQLLDALDFAPAGVIELIKDYAIALELNDMSKRQAISNKTGVDINRIIENNRLEKEAEAKEKKENKSAEAPAATGRRSAPITEKVEEKPATAPGRRAQSTLGEYTIKK